MNKWVKNIKSGLKQWQHLLPKTGEQAAFLHSEIESILDEIEKPLRINILGEFKAGKSAFINMLLQEEVVISHVNPATSVTTVLQYGTAKAYKVKMTNGQFNEITKEKFSQLSAETNGELKWMRDLTDHLIVELPSEFLKNVTLVDNPGYGSNKDHDAMTDRHIGNCDCALWLFPHGMIGTAIEVDRLKRLEKMGIPVYGIITKKDMHKDEEPIETYVDSVGRKFQGLLQSIFAISTFLAKKSNNGSNQKLWKQSNWSAITNLFNELSTQQAKEKRVVRRLHDLLQVTTNLIETKTEELSYSELETKIDRILKSYIPEVEKNYAEVRTNRKSPLKIVTALDELFDLELQSTESIAEHIRLLENLEQIEPLYLLHSVEWNRYSTALKELIAFNVKVEEQRLRKKRIVLSFDELQMKKTRTVCEDLLEQQQQYNKKILTLKEHEIYLSVRNKRIRQELSLYTQELTQKLDKLYDLHMRTLHLSETKWQEKWRFVTGEIASIDSETLDVVEELRIVLESYQSTVGKFIQENHIGREVEKEQEAITNLNLFLMQKRLRLPVEELLQARKELHSLEPIYEQGKHSALRQIKFSLFDDYAITLLPELLKLPIEDTLEELRRKSKRRNKRIQIAALVAFLFWRQDDIKHITGAIVVQSIIAIHSVMADFEGGSEEANELNEVYDVNESTSSLPQAVPATQAAEPVTVQAQSTLVEITPTIQEEPAFESEPIIEQDIFVLDDFELQQELGAVVLEFRDYYEGAVNSGDFSYVANFFNPSGSAYNEIREYLQDIEGEGTYFEFESNEVNDVLALSNGNWIVRTSEVFIFTGNEGDQWRYAKQKEYELTQSQEGYLEILEIRNITNDKQRIEE